MGALSRYHLLKSEFNELVAGEIERLKDEMSLGLLKNHEEYKSLSGKILGLRAALDLMEEADSSVSKKIGA
jgi:hypothetical protein